MSNLVPNYITDLQSAISNLSQDEIERAAERLHQARLQRKQVFVVGNGGSASTASHIVCDLAKNTRRPDLPPFRIYELADSTAVFTAYSNDEGYENAMANHLANFVEPDDVILAISTSGNSPNILRAVEVAQKAGATTIGLTGFSGGQLMPDVDMYIHVDSYCIEHVEDIHLVIGHILTTILRQKDDKQ